MHTVPPILQGTAAGSCVWPQCCSLWVQPMARVSGLGTAVSGYSCWLVCLPSVLHSLSTAAGSCACPRYCILWVQLLARVSGLSTAFSGYSCWLVCLASVLHSLGTAAGSCIWPKYCILWVQLLALASVLHSLGTAAGSWPALSTAFSGYSRWLMCLLTVLLSLDISVRWFFVLKTQKQRRL